MLKSLAIVGTLAIGAMLMPSPATATVGQPVTADEAQTLIGGACGNPSPANCSNYSGCGSQSGKVSAGTVQCTMLGTACNSNCNIWHGANRSCNAGG
ncbi:MAG: hypothetical protein AAF989_12700 [Planctomycetota bacterium]